MALEVEVLWTAWTLRNCCAEPADLKRCISARAVLVRVLGAIVHSQPLLVAAGQAKNWNVGGIGAWLVGDRQLGRKSPRRWKNLYSC